MLLPDEDMNSARYRVAQDRIDESLYECFPDGSLFKYFEYSEELLIEWIKAENLELMFDGGIIKRDNIISLIRSMSFVTYSDMTDEELDEFLSAAVEFIKRRKLLQLKKQIMQGEIHFDVPNVELFCEKCETTNYFYKDNLSPFLCDVCGIELEREI